MSHTTENKKKLQSRISRIQGQLKSVSESLEMEEDCGKVLQTVAAAKGAINGLMHEILEGFVDSHVLNPSKGQSKAQKKAASNELKEIIKRYLK